ncbi:MAG: hypothetical protein ACYTHN_21870, partial [Planctomycetota bacterium]
PPPAVDSKSPPLSQEKKKEFKALEGQLHDIFAEGAGEGTAPPPQDPEGEPSSPVTEGAGQPAPLDLPGMESALADILQSPSSDAVPPPPPQPPPRKREGIALVGRKRSPDTQTVQGIRASGEGKREPEAGPPPPVNQDLPDFVTRVMTELDHRMGKSEKPAETVEVPPESSSGEKPPPPTVAVKPDPKTRTLPKKNLDALKDLFTEDA